MDNPKSERRTAFFLVVVLVAVIVSEGGHIAAVLHLIGGDAVFAHTLGVWVDASEPPRATIHMLTVAGAATSWDDDVYIFLFSDQIPGRVCTTEAELCRLAFNRDKTIVTYLTSRKCIFL